MSKPRVVLIDLSALFYPSWHASADKPVSTAFESTIGGVNRVCAQFPDALVAIAADGKGNWRKELSPEYKAQRERQTDVFYQQLDSVKDRLRADGRLLWEQPGYEADDVIATACMKAMEAGHQVTIATSDKDLFQLVRSNSCEVLSLSSWEIRTEDFVRTKFGVPPRQMHSLLALWGDSSDNVPGCDGCGAVKAAKLLAKFETYEDVCNALAGDIVDIVGPALAGKIMMNRDAIRLSAQLVALKTDVPIRFEEIYEKREVALQTRQESPMEKAIIETGMAAKMGADADYGVAELPFAGIEQAKHFTSQKNLDEQQFFGFQGAGVAAFPESASKVLSEPVDENDVEIHPMTGAVYLSGTFYRRQLTRAFGHGGWALLPRSRPVASDGVVAWHGALVCLGRFVSEAFGEKDYRPNNPQDSYPTSVEAAKTDCLRRCVKDLGWSGELWSKQWTEDWKKRHAEQYKENGRTLWRKVR